MANQDSPLYERLGLDHGLSPPWTSNNISKALKFGLFITPPEEKIIERGKAFQMVNSRATYQCRLWIPETPSGEQQSLFPLQVMITVQYLPSLKSTSSILTCV